MMDTKAQEKDERKKAMLPFLVSTILFATIFVVGYFFTKNVLFLVVLVITISVLGLLMARKASQLNKKYNSKVGFRKGAIIKTILLAFFILALSLLYDLYVVELFGHKLEWLSKLLNAMIYGLPMLYLFLQVEHVDSE